MSSKIGKILHVEHATDGQGKYRNCKKVQRTIAAEYLDGAILDSAGDVWQVRAGNDGHYYTLMTVIR